MGLDIKTLRIGSSVLYKGERVEVWSIEKECGCYGITVHNKAKKYEDNMFHSSKDPYLIQTGVKRLDPIPITEELLRELGFSDAHENITTYTKKIGEHFIYLIKINGEETYDLSIIHNNGIRNVAMEVKYLHELEQFVFMTCKTELISNN